MIVISEFVWMFVSQASLGLGGLVNAPVRALSEQRSGEQVTSLSRGGETPWVMVDPWLRTVAKKQH